MKELRAWYKLILLASCALEQIHKAKPQRQYGRLVFPLQEYVRAGIQGCCCLLRVYAIHLERQMNTLALMDPNSDQCKGKEMTTQTENRSHSETRSEHSSRNQSNEMLQEFLLELNPSDAHIVVRCNTLALAQEYCTRLFPKSYVKPGPTANCWVIQLAETEVNGNEALGIIQLINVPNKWVMNRRLQDEGKTTQRTERAA